MRNNDKSAKPYLNYLTGILVEVLAILSIALASFIIIALIASCYK